MPRPRHVSLRLYPGSTGAIEAPVEYLDLETMMPKVGPRVRIPFAPPASPFFSPVSSVRNRITPGIQFLIHANIKTSFEYQIRPRQIVYSPSTGAPITNPFRTNSAVAGLEFVY